MAKKQSMICKHCGKMFLAFSWKVKQGYGRYCSNACKATVGGLSGGVIGKHGRVSGDFDKKFVINIHTGCWEWIASKNRDGYGRYGLDKKNYLAHRFSWIKTYGEIQDDFLVLHKCDNPSCVNPEHLFLGDCKANIRDMIEKGRASWQKNDNHIQKA